MSRMPPSFRGGLVCADAACAPKASAAASTPDRTRFIKTSRHAALRSLYLRCRNHAVSGGVRQAAQRRRQSCGRCRITAFSAKRNGLKRARFSNQQSLARNMIELEPHSIRVFEQQRIISRRPLIFARRADDRHVERTQKAVQLIDVGALAGTKTEMVQADAALLKYCAGMFGRRLAYPQRRPSADPLVEFLAIYH